MINKSRGYEFRYIHQPNVCTFGYTTQWWNWTRWESYLDWMALHGFNLPMLPLAHEAVLQRVKLIFYYDYIGEPEFGRSLFA